MPNPVVHFEIMAGPSANKAALQDFYRKTFDWEIQSAGVPGASAEESYGLVPAPESGPGIGGAVDQSPDGPQVIVYIQVPDPQAALERAQANGATVLQDVTAIPGMVTFATFRDPAGNVVGIVAEATPPA